GEAGEDLSRRAADARAAHAALVERAAALATEVQRLEENAAELESRSAALAVEFDDARGRIARLQAAIVAGDEQLQANVLRLEMLQRDVQATDAKISDLRSAAETQEAAVSDARGSVDSIRAFVAELDVARATALSHLS